MLFYCLSSLPLLLRSFLSLTYLSYVVKRIFYFFRLTSQSHSPIYLLLLRRINWKFVAVDLPTIHSSLLLEFIVSSHTRRRPTFPGSCPPSIISAKELNFRVRDGNGCVLFAIITRSSPNPISSTVGRKKLLVGLTQRASNLCEQ